jgi:uridylate kinase
MFNNSICAFGTKTSAMKTIVLSLGGSILIPTLEKNRLGSYAKVLTAIARKHRLFVVAGGGGEARRYIDVARGLGIDEGTADEIGILVTRLNATLLIASLGDAAFPRVAGSQTEAIAFSQSEKIVVMGGITPGQTTDAVAAVLAERAGADLLVNLTSVDGIYSADPEKVKGAVRYEQITPKKLIAAVGGAALRAGANTVIDIVAARVIERSGVPLLVMDGRNPLDLERAVLKGEFTGTVVSSRKKIVLPL